MGWNLLNFIFSQASHLHHCPEEIVLPPEWSQIVVTVICSTGKTVPHDSNFILGIQCGFVLVFSGRTVGSVQSDKRGDLKNAALRVNVWSRAPSEGPPRRRRGREQTHEPSQRHCDLIYSRHILRQQEFKSFRWHHAAMSHPLFPFQVRSHNAWMCGEDCSDWHIHPDP